MATYTLTIDLSGFVWPASYVELRVNNGDYELTPDYTSIQTIASTLCSEILGNLISGGECSITYTNNSLTIIITPNNSPATNLGDLVSLGFLDNEGNQFFNAWIPTTTTPCPNCQDVAITNCGAVEISLPLPDDDYLVTLYDNQSGVSYEQNVQWTSGTGTWNTTNTAGVFTPFTIFTLTVTDSQGTPVSWPVGPNEYTCARVTFSATVDTNVND